MKQLDAIMQKEVSRGEFLGLSGLALASVFGLGGVLRLVTGRSLVDEKQRHGYGDSPYGV